MYSVRCVTHIEKYKVDIVRILFISLHLSDNWSANWLYFEFGFFFFSNFSSTNAKLYSKSAFEMEVPEASLLITVENVHKLTEFYSEPFSVRGLQWKVRVMKHNTKWLAVHLLCEERIKPTNKFDYYSKGKPSIQHSVPWSCMAHCKFELNPFSRKPFVRSFKQPREYSVQRSHGFLKFIGMKELLDPANNYVEDDSIVFSIKVKANAPTNITEQERKIETKPEQILKSVRLTINKMNDVNGYFSPEFNVCGLPWRIKVYTTKVRDTKAVSVMLNCVHKASTMWECKARAVFRLISSDPCRPSHEWMFKTAHSFNKKSKSFGRKKFIKWDDLHLQNRFVKNGSLILEVEIIVEEVVGIEKEKFQCSVCYENLYGKTISSTICGHLFCKFCIEQCIQFRSVCPLCGQKTNLDGLRTIYFT